MSLLPPEIRPSLTGVNLFTQKHQPLGVNCGRMQTEAAKSFLFVRVVDSNFRSFLVAE